jgi:HK97 family phage major capsid protein
MDIHSKEKSPIHDLKDAVLAGAEQVDNALAKFEERGAALDAETKEIKASLEVTRGLYENVNKRLDELDKSLPKGDKFYRPANGEDARAKAREGVGQMVVDLARTARGLGEKYDFWKNARTQKEGAVYTTGTPDPGGGYLVPPEQANEIIRLVSNFGLARKLCRIMPMTREIMRLPVATYGPTTLVGNTITSSGATNLKAVSTEASGVPQSTQSFTRPELVATRLMALDNISIEVDEDSSPDLMSFLVDVFAEAVALAEDYQVLRADHTPFTGIMVETGAGGVQLIASGVSYKNTKYTDLISIYNKVDEKVQENGVWVGSNYVWNQLQAAMVDSNGRPFNLSDTQSSVSDAAPRRIFGRPFYTSTVMPKATDDASGSKFLIYGDFKYAIFGDRKRMSIDISPHAGFTTGELVMRVMERFAFQAVLCADGTNPGVFSVGKTN